MSDPRVEALARELSCHEPQGESWKIDAPEARRLLAVVDKVDPARDVANAVVAMMSPTGIDITRVGVVLGAVHRYLESQTPNNLPGKPAGRISGKHLPP